MPLAASACRVAPALAEKPQTVLPGPTTTTVTAIPIDFDRDNPRRKEFGKLIFRAGLNLYAKSSYFGGYSAHRDRSVRAFAAGASPMPAPGCRATLDYDGRKLKGLSDVVLGPMLGADGKPLRDERLRDSEGMALVDGDTRQGTAYRVVRAEAQDRALSLHRRQVRTADRHGAPAAGGTKGMTANRGIEAMTMIRTGTLKGTLVAFAERLTDKNGNLRGWLIGGPTPGEIVLKRLGGFDITDAAALPDGGIVVLGAAIPLSAKASRCASAASPPSEIKARRADRGRGAARSRRQLQHRQYGGDRRSPRGVGRDRADADVGRQFQRAAAHADHAVHAA